MELVSFVILHFRDKKITDDCVRSILRMERQEQIRIVIVDNDISREEEERRRLFDIYQDDPRIFVLPIRENGGFSYANNQGYRFARENLRASWIVVLNNDIQFRQPDFLRLMKESCERHPCHVLGPDIICPETGRHQNPMAVRLRTRGEAESTVRRNRWALRFYPAAYPAASLQMKRIEKRNRRQEKENRKFYGEAQKGIVPFGACLIFTPDFVRMEPLAFEPETRFFYEEYILAYRCRKKGYQIVYDPALCVFHKGSSEMNKTFQEKSKRLRFRMERTAEACEVYLKLLQEDQDGI